MSPAGVFLPDGPHRLVPTEAAVGPWDPNLVHGAAVAALFAGRLSPDDATLARLTVEISAPVPHGPLEWSCTPATGGTRVQRQRAALSVDGREVAAATSVIVRRTELELPAGALHHPSPFDPRAAPALDEPNAFAAEFIGWPCFDSTAVSVQSLEVAGDERLHQWLALRLPIVAGAPRRGAELAAVAADYAQSAISRHLPFDDWSFRNAELTLHLARDPVGDWVGLRCESVVQPLGTGFNTADLFDEVGRLGRSSSVVVVEPRRRALADQRPGATS